MGFSNLVILISSLFQLGAIRTKKIFVGGLRPETTEETLREYFEQFGNVSMFLICFN